MNQRVELLSAGCYAGLQCCEGKIFTPVNRVNSNGTVRIAIAQLIAAGYPNPNGVTTSLYFFDWEVRLIND